METSLLARLSPELRNTIYEYAFTSDYAITLRNDGIQHALTRTCRRLRLETLEMHYSLARFNAHLDDGPATPLARWLKTIGRDRSLLLNEVNIWDMHMLNATLHGAASTQKMLASLTKDGKRYVLQPIGSWLLNRGWYLKDIVVTLHSMGLELRNLALVSGVDDQVTRANMTSHFALVPSTEERLRRNLACARPDLQDLLENLGFSEDMIEEVLRALLEMPVGESGCRELRVRRARRDIFMYFERDDLKSIRQTFIPREEDIVF